MISIVMPVYNSERYLHSSIDSIVSQNYSDFELLLVDDGSTDGSGRLCDEYARTDERITVFHKTNGGVSSARNLGIGQANGQWLLFADSDDFLLPNSLEQIDAAITAEHADLHLFDYQQNGETVFMSLKDNVTKSEFVHSLLTYKIQTSPWAKAYNTDIIRKNDLCFKEGLKIGEDLLFNFEYVVSCSDGIRICHHQNAVYNYCYREGSAMNSSNVKDKYIQLNDVAIPVMREKMGHYNDEDLASFELINIFQGNWKTSSIPTDGEIERMLLLSAKTGYGYMMLLDTYLKLAKCNSVLANIYLKYRCVRRYIKEFTNKSRNYG